MLLACARAHRHPLVFPSSVHMLSITRTQLHLPTRPHFLARTHTHMQHIPLALSSTRRHALVVPLARAFGPGPGAHHPCKRPCGRRSRCGYQAGICVYAHACGRTAALYRRKMGELPPTAGQSARRGRGPKRRRRHERRERRPRRKTWATRRRRQGWRRQGAAGGGARRAECPPEALACDGSPCPGCSPPPHWVGTYQSTRPRRARSPGWRDCGGDGVGGGGWGLWSSSSRKGRGRV